MVIDVKNGAKALILALACLASVASLRAESTPYDIIASRNIFGLGKADTSDNQNHELPKPVIDVKVVRDNDDFPIEAGAVDGEHARRGRQAGTALGHVG